MRYNFFICLLLILLTGCDDFIEIETPGTDVETKDVFKHNETATAAVTTIYSQMVDSKASTFLIAFLTGLCADELINPANDDATGFYINWVDPVANYYNYQFWKAAYQIIYSANKAYEGCKNSTDLDEDIKKQLMAEALFVRAYWFFYLVNLYGDIPLPTTTDPAVNAVLSRLSTVKVYQQIIMDLKIAQRDLNESYIGFDGKPTTIERVRPNKATATALLARVYLYTDDFQNAAIQATSIIDNSSTYSLVPLKQVFLKNSREAIWQIMPSTPNYSSINTYEGFEFILTHSPVLTKQPSINGELIKAFDEGDLRRTNWIGEYTDTAVYYYSYKYRITNSSDLTEYTMIFRLAEQYLIRAEANVEMGKFTEALQDINIIRQRAGLPLLTSQTSLPEAILKERQTELFTEQGHRWFDLKRTRNVDAVMKVVCPLKSGTWRSAMQYWSIPSVEILNNPHLVQNTGYN